MPTKVLAYQQLGTFLMVVMTASWIYATFFFQSLCRIVGPNGKFAQIVLPCDNYCKQPPVDSTSQGKTLTHGGNPSRLKPSLTGHIATIAATSPYERYEYVEDINSDKRLDNGVQDDQFLDDLDDFSHEIDSYYERYSSDLDTIEELSTDDTNSYTNQSYVKSEQSIHDT